MEKVFIHDGRVAIYCNSNVMENLLRKRGDRQLVRSISDLMVAMLVPAPIDATPDENTLEKSRNVLVSLWRAQEQNRALRAQVQTAQSVEEVQGIEPVTVDKGKLTATF